MPKVAFKESELYPHVERWMTRHFHCFKTGINVGLRYSRVDVMGVRDVGGDLSGETESVAIEMKRGSEPFATASGQALGYQVYANRVYLADYRKDGFTRSELDIASHLGIGLIKVWGKQCNEVLSSPYHKPVPRLALSLLERMALGTCQFCGTVFEIGVRGNRFGNLCREDAKKALAKERGLMFWNRQIADRKRRLGVRMSALNTTFERRFVCPDCVNVVFSSDN